MDKNTYCKILYCFQLTNIQDITTLYVKKGNYMINNIAELKNIKISLYI